MGRVDDHEDLSIETYFPVKSWILQREIKLRLRKNTRSGKGRNPDDMVYGVDIADGQQQAAPSKTQEAPGPDPWLASASDPWSSPPGLPPTQAAAQAPVWPPDDAQAWAEWSQSGGDLDAFQKGKGKGKGESKPVLECWGCLGLHGFV